MNRRGQGGGVKGLELEMAFEVSLSRVSMRGLQLLYRCHCFIQCLYSQCRRADGIPHLAERTVAEYAPGEAG